MCVVKEVQTPTDLLPTKPSDAPYKTALGFFTLEGLDPALVVSNYSVQEELGILIELARHDSRPTIRLEAIDRIRRYLKEALILSGQIRQNQATMSQTLADGRELTATATQFQMPETASQTEQMLLSAAQTSHRLSMEDSNVPTPEEVPVIDVAGPKRDLGGGGLCNSARREADAAADAEAARREGRSEDSDSAVGGSDPEEGPPPA